jgi:hypothetical protein
MLPMQRLPLAESGQLSKLVTLAYDANVFIGIENCTALRCRWSDASIKRDSA